MQQNNLHTKCSVCGRVDDFLSGDTFHSFTGYAGYGSKYDGEYITLHFCSECLDKMLDYRENTEVNT